MRNFLILLILLVSCNNKSQKEIDRGHIEAMAKDFMKNTVIPKMQDPKPYEIDSANVVVKTEADQINDYRFVYEHFSKNHFDSVQNKRHLDSMINISKKPESIISITVNVSYKTRYKYGDVVVDSIKLAYDQVNDKISFWPF
ncbi:MAG: hypothetical protein ABIN25_03740 [Ginsengibacter sp.]